MSQITALDLFAGTGWGVACQRMGIDEKGVEIMPEAIETREANGMETVFHDVWDGLEDPFIVPFHRLQIASPPCQAFSMAGHGAGRKALDDVLSAVYEGLYTDYAELREFARQMGDERIALVLTPLAYAHEWRPEFIAWEQVPPVLPVWETCATVLREWGYSVETGILNSEQYGVPQTRRRAILVARRDGVKVELPKPTHSRYYPRTPEKLDEGVLPWVSMAQALGWGFAQRPSYTVCGVSAHAIGDRGWGGASVRRALMDARDSGDPQVWEPDAAKESVGPVIVTAEEAATLQSYPSMLRSNYGTGGDASNRGLRAADQPAPTLTSKADRNKWDGERAMTSEEAAALQSYPVWPYERPAPTVVGTRRSEGGMLIGRQLDDDSRRDRGGHQTSVGLREGMLPGVRVSGEQGSALQTYPQPFVWKGSKSKQFLQIGNAYPPLLAYATLRALLAASEWERYETEHLEWAK